MNLKGLLSNRGGLSSCNIGKTPFTFCQTVLSKYAKELFESIISNQYVNDRNNNSELKLKATLLKTTELSLSNFYIAGQLQDGALKLYSKALERWTLGHTRKL